MFRGRIQVAASVCVLAAGVVMGAPGVAKAESDETGTVTTSADATTNVSQTDDKPSSGATAATDAAARDAAEGVTSTLGSGREPGDPVASTADKQVSTVGSGREPGDPVASTADKQVSTVGSGREPGDPVVTGAPTAAKALALADETADETDSAVVATDPEPVDSATDLMTESPTTTAATTATKATPTTATATTAAITTETATTATEPAGTAATEAARVADQPATVNTDASPAAVAQVDPVVAPPVAAPVIQVQVPPPVDYVALFRGWVIAPIRDVVAAVRYMVAAAASVVLTSIQYGLTLLFAITGVEPALDTLGRIGFERPTAAEGSLGSGISRAEPFAVPRNAASFEATQLVVSGTSKAVGTTEALRAAPELAASAAPAFGASISESARSFVRDIGRTLVESPSLMALAMAALPGLFGLFLLTGGGVRVGYRQAKADLVMHRHGLAQFAGMGPIGVVRSESLVSVRLRPSQVRQLDGQANSEASRLKLIC